MKNRLIGFVGFAVLAIITASPVSAQNRTLSSVAGDKWVITAKAGGVNFVQGTVQISRPEGKSGLLIKGDSVEVGDRVSTGSDGRAEILLNPGSYLRAAENSLFEFKSTELEDLQISVTRGSVMLEVFAANDFKVSVTTPKESIDLVESGVYRVDVAVDGNARVEVWKGKAEVGDSVLKGGRTASSLDGQLAVAKFDRDERDNFESWSRDRAKELAKGTNALRDKTLRTSLMRSFLGGRWNTYDSFGLWVFDARSGRYAFLPFGFGWSSPYGFGYNTDIWWYRLPQAVFYPPRNRPIAGTPPSGGTPPAGTPPGGSPPRDRRPIMGGRKVDPEGAERKDPPFVRMQGNGRGTGREFGGFNPVNPDGGSSGGTGDFGRSIPRGMPSSGSPASSPRAEPSAPVSRGVGPIRGKGDPIN